MVWLEAFLIFSIQLNDNVELNKTSIDSTNNNPKVIKSAPFWLSNQSIDNLKTTIKEESYHQISIGPPTTEFSDEATDSTETLNDKANDSVRKYSNDNSKLIQDKDLIMTENNE